MNASPPSSYGIVGHKSCETLYTTDSTGLLKSEDSGVSWVPVNTAGLEVEEGSGDLVSSGNTLVLRYPDSVYASTDEGISWIKAQGDIPVSRQLIADPLNPDTLYTLAYDGRLHKSIDGGLTWQLFAGESLQNLHVQSLAIDPGNSQSLFVATTVGVFHSGDGGTHWQETNQGLDATSINRVSIQESSEDPVLYVASSTGSYKKPLAGTTWERLTDPVGLLSSASITTGSQDVWVLASNRFGADQLFHSSDQGTHWSEYTLPNVVPSYAPISYSGNHLVGPHFNSVYSFENPADPVYRNHLYLAGGQTAIVGRGWSAYYLALYRSTNQGRSWSLLPDLDSVIQYGFTPNPQLVLNLQDTGLSYVYDGFRYDSNPGQGKPATTRLFQDDLMYGNGGLAFDPGDARLVYVGAYRRPLDNDTQSSPVQSQGFYKSTDAGHTWRMSGLQSHLIRSIAVHPGSPNIIYAGHEKGVAKSNDYGETWAEFSTGLPVTEVKTLDIHENRVVAGTDHGVYMCSPKECGLETPPTTQVVEFYNQSLNRYFMTANPTEARQIDSGSAGYGWQRSGLSFKAWLSESAGPSGLQEVCRFYAPNPNSHFYTLAGPECEAVKQNGDWIWESSNRFYLFRPDGEVGCPAQSQPVYRLYNNRFENNDSNHRYTTDIGMLDQMKNRGWLDEGIAFCAPL